MYELSATAIFKKHFIVLHKSRKLYVLDDHEAYALSDFML